LINQLKAFPVQMTVTSIAAARERLGISVSDLAAAIGVNEPSCWDLLSDSAEVAGCLSLRQFLRLASVLRVAPLSLLPKTPPPRAGRTLSELATAIREFCAARDLGIEQFSDYAGWDVQPFLDSPDSALDEWCLDTLCEICEALSVHWPDYLPDAACVA
jgi:transcriptional regulator with XRE-family HTH domain